MRYFFEIAYDGTNYSGWQRQPNASSVQQVLEESLSTLLQSKISILGCGRTDAGVHASSSFFHVDLDAEIDSLQHKLNIFLPKDISIKRIIKTHEDAHARFDATQRSYTYHIHLLKDPFNDKFSYYFPQHKGIDRGSLHQSADLIKNYSEFFPFCKTNTDVKTMNCQLFESKWICHESSWEYHISADRFLRGMVRLIVGMCLNVAMGKMNLDEVKKSIEKQERLSRDLSAPARGLFLTEVRYPYIDTA